MQGTTIKGKPVKVSQGVSRNPGNQGSGHGKSSGSHSQMNNSLMGIYGNPALLASGAGGSPKGGILGGLGVQFKSPEGLPQNLMGLHPGQYMAPQPGHPVLSYHQAAAMGYGMTMNPSMYGHPLVAQQALIYGYPQQSGFKEFSQMPGETGASTIEPSGNIVAHSQMVGGGLPGQIGGSFSFIRNSNTWAVSLSGLSSRGHDGATMGSS